MPDRKATSSRFIVAASAIAILFLVGVLVLTLGRVLNLQDVLLRPRAVNQCKDDCLASKVDCRNGCGGIADKGDKDSCLQGCENSFGSSCVAGCDAGPKTCPPPGPCFPGTEVCDTSTGKNYCPGDKPADKCVPGNGHPAACFPGQEVCDKATGSWYCPFDKPPTASPKPKPGGGGAEPTPKPGGGGGGGGGTGGVSVVNTAGCNAQSPGCVWSCYQKVGNCSGCINYNAKGCTGPLPGGGTTKGNNTACYDSCFSKTGNGSGCKAACDASPTCFNKCVKDGKAPKSCLVPCATGAYLTPTPVPGEPEVVCQGNVDAPAKCFDCLKDSQLNILDFSCFRNKYGKEVGK